MKLTIVIPALNEAKTIGSVIQSIPRNIPSISDIQIIVIDDGSQDETAKISLNHGATVIKHEKNLGLGRTFKEGLEKSMQLKADIMVTIDADNQFDPQEIPQLIKPIIENKSDFVTGTRFAKNQSPPKSMPFIKKWGNKKLAAIISFASNQKIHDVSCGFRAYSKEAMLNLNLFGSFTYTQETILDLAYKKLRIKEVPITVKYFDDRISRVANSIIRYALRSGSIIIRTVKDYRPLAFFGSLGIIIFTLGLFFDIALLIYFFQTRTFSPYKAFGFLGAFLNAIGVLVVFIAILSDQIDKIRINQEKLLYFEKLRKYYNE